MSASLDSRGDAAPRSALPRHPAALALLATLALWLAHASLYSFLTDDAFISFRYARNLSHGFGLVFNPGLERVEGYTNFLFVLILATLDRAGLRPEIAANVVLLAATVLLWALIGRWAWRRAPDGAGRWLTVAPLALLGLTRSIAVWSTSGLETRLFELFVTAGVMRLIGEISRIERGAGAGPPLAGLAFGLAALTRPDGALIGACALAAVAARHAIRRRPAPRIAIGRAAPFLALVAAHFAFRLAYYGAWWPNTYYAKVGGRALWGSGLEYVATFALEYFAWIWIPIAVFGVLRCVRRGDSLVPIVWGAAVLPHLMYVIAIGGDHFEYRPLGLAIVAGVLAMFEAMLAAWERGVPRLAIALSCLLVAAGAVWLPWQTHVQFPSGYQSGYPGLAGGPEREFLDEARTPGGALPVLRGIREIYRAHLGSMTSRYVGVRQEEHRRFEDEVMIEARRIRALMDRGALARDARVAMGSVGVIPYVTDLPTLDVLGLTDAHVARSPFVSRMLGHGKHATLAYAAERGVELWFEGGVRLLRSNGSSGVIRVATAPDSELTGVFAADAGDGLQALARLPRGVAEAARAAPGLGFEPLGAPLGRAALLERLIAWHEEALREQPSNAEIGRRLALLRSRLEEGQRETAESLRRRAVALEGAVPRP